MVNVEEASEADYVMVQGGKPRVEKRGGATVIVHDYDGGDGMEVVGMPVEHYGEVNYTVGGAVKRFKVALLRAFHGEPCEKSSQAIGGSSARYDRKKR